MTIIWGQKVFGINGHGVMNCEMSGYLVTSEQSVHLAFVIPVYLIHTLLFVIPAYSYITVLRQHLAASTTALVHYHQDHLIP